MVDLSDEQERAVREVRRALPDTRLLLIGATALRQHITLDYRVSTDLDLVIDISPDAFPGPLAEIPGWRQHRKMEHRFFTAEGQTVDALPAGEVVRATGKLVWPDAEMNMEGIDLAFEHAVLEGELLVPPAPALALLKMRSWLDRPTQRRKDLVDLAHLMRRYVSEDDEAYWEAGLHEHDDFDAEAVSPFILGRDLARLARDVDSSTIEAFLERATVERLMATRAWPFISNAASARDAFERGLTAG